MSKLGVGRYLRLLGVMEIAFAALFVVPATMKLGFILASCYVGGAIATELSHGTLKVNPFTPIALLWIGAFIRDRSIGPWRYPAAARLTSKSSAVHRGLGHRPTTAIWPRSVAATAA